MIKRNNSLLFLKYSLIFITLFVISTLLINSSYASQAHNSQTSTTPNSDNDFWYKLNLADENKRKDPSLFNELINQLHQKQHLLSNKQQHFLSLLYGYSYAYKGQHDKAESHLESLLSSDISPLLKFRTNSLLIYVMAAKKNWGKGLEYVAYNIDSLSLMDKNQHYQSALIAIVIFYNQIKQYDLALSYLDKLALEKLTPTNQCFLQQLTLEAKVHLKQLQPTDAVIGDGLAACQQANFTIAEHIIRTYKAKLLLPDSPKKSIQALLPHLDDAQKTQYPMLLAEIYNALGQAFLKVNDISSAAIYANKALSENKNNSNLLQGVDTYFLLYQIAKKQQDSILALSYYEQYSEIEKANLEGEKAKYLAFQLAQHKAVEQTSKIELLNKKNLLLQAEKALSAAEVANTRLAIAILMVSLLLLGLWGLRLYKTNKQIKALAEYDALTGIFNRGHFTQVAHDTINFCQSTNQDLSIIIFDLDHFKSVNDNFGHATGDWALQETVKACQDLGRKNDIFARLGGEEFCILLPSCQIRSAALVAEYCRSAIEDIVTDASGHRFSITASFGVTDAQTSGFDLANLLADADEAAYKSKHGGRNRVTVFESKVAAPQKSLDGSWDIT